MSFPNSCDLCARRCGIDRRVRKGACGMDAQLKAARAALHFWEEPCISGSRGSGTVFFSGCPLSCCFCQNFPISQDGFGKALSVSALADVFRSLEQQGAHNINLVNPTHFAPLIREAILRSRVKIPFVYNSGGYDTPSALGQMAGLVQIYLPDVKYFSEELAIQYSRAPHYFETAMAAVQTMVEQVGPPVFDEDGILQRGVIVRHMVLPSHWRDSLQVLRRLWEAFGRSLLYSIMCQYAPMYHSAQFHEIDRRVTTYENRKVTDFAADLGMPGYMQGRSSATSAYTPSFDLTGL